MLEAISILLWSAGSLDGTEEVIVALGSGDTAAVTTTEIYHLGTNAWRSGPPVPSATPVFKVVPGAYNFILVTSGTAKASFFDTINLVWSNLDHVAAGSDLSTASGVVVVDNKDYDCAPNA